MIVRVRSGLMSRVRLLEDAYLAVKKYNITSGLTIIWPCEHYCNIHYDEVFSTEQFSDIKMSVIEENPQGFVPQPTVSLVALLKKGRIYAATKEIIRRYRKKHLEDKYCKGREGIFYNNAPKIVNADFGEYGEWKQKKWLQIKECLENNRDIYISAYEAFSIPRDVSSIGTDIIFLEKYNKKVDEVIGEHKNLIGVHIRRTDHTVAIEESPLELFVNHITEEIENDTRVAFFLSTDDINVEQEFMNRFGDRIVVQKGKMWGNNNKESMECGIVDCLCLARCKKIYGSFSSQFSGFAAEYANIPIEVLKKSNE